MEVDKQIISKNEEWKKKNKAQNGISALKKSNI